MKDISTLVLGHITPSQSRVLDPCTKNDVLQVVRLDRCVEQVSGLGLYIISADGCDELQGIVTVLLEFSASVWR